MKKQIKYLVIMVFALVGLVTPTKLKAETDNGQWFRFADQNYTVTMDDVNNIATLSDQGNLVAGKLYQTRSGMKFYTKYPSQWRAKMLTILTKVRGSLVTSLVAGFNGGTIVPWDAMNITVKSDNYYINNGVEGHFTNYSGGASVRVLKVNGYPVMKVGAPCFNPEDPYMTTTTTVVTPPPTVVYVPAPRVDTVYQPAQTGCPCSTYVACTTCGTLPMSAVSGMSFNQYYALQQTTFGQLPTSSNDRYGSFHGAYGNMYTSIGQTPGYQNAVYSATSGQQMVWAYAGYSSPQCCVQQVAVNPCPCGQQPQQPTPAPAVKKRGGGWIVAGVIATGVIVYAIFGKKTNQPDSGGPGTQGGGLKTGGPGTQGQ